METRRKHLVTGAAIAVVLMLAIIPFSQSHAKGVSGPLPPGSEAFGKTLEEWQTLYWLWYLNQDDRSDHVGKVKFLPLPQGEPVGVNPDNPDVQIIKGSLSLTLKSATPFVLPVSAWLGERYADHDPPVEDDSPQFLIDNQVFETTSVLVKMDGRILLAGTGTEVFDFLVGPIWFDEPQYYDPPQLRYDDVYAAAGIWYQGIAIVCPPLPVGEHLLELVAITPALGVEFQNTWHITVVPRGKKFKSAMAR